MKHDRNLCVECVYVGMCDGQPADDCDLMDLTEFETALNGRMAELNDQFSKIGELLESKKEAFAEMYRKNPKMSLDETGSILNAINKARVVHGWILSRASCFKKHGKD